MRVPLFFRCFIFWHCIEDGKEYLKETFQVLNIFFNIRMIENIIPTYIFNLTISFWCSASKRSDYIFQHSQMHRWKDKHISVLTTGSFSACNRYLICSRVGRTNYTATTHFFNTPIALNPDLARDYRSRVASSRLFVLSAVYRRFSVVNCSYTVLSLERNSVR